MSFLIPPLPRLSGLSRHAVLAGLLCCGAVAHADEGIVTDRPDFVESSAVVGAGRFQIETGFASERNKADGFKTTLTSTPTLLRIGINERWEFRVETDGYARLRARDLASGAVVRERGMSDTSLGLKWHMQDGDEATGQPAMAWLFHADLDSGARAFCGNGVRPSVRAVAEWDLPDAWSVGLMPGLLLDRNAAGRRFAAGILAVTVGKDWSDRFHSFVELAGQQLASTRNGGTVLTFDLGGAYALTNSVQLDMALSRGLNKNTPDLAWTVGLSLKF
jgi:hypothetical protein